MNRHFAHIRWYGRWTYGIAIDQSGGSLHLGPHSFWFTWKGQPDNERSEIGRTHEGLDGQAKRDPSPSGRGQIEQYAGEFDADDAGRAYETAQPDPETWSFT